MVHHPILTNGWKLLVMNPGRGQTSASTCVVLRVYSLSYPVVQISVLPRG